MSSAYIALTAVISNNPELLQTNRNDLLKHDRLLLTNQSGPIVPNRFGWIVNVSCTHLLEDTIGVEAADMFDDSFHPTKGSCRTSTDEFYLWNGTALRSVDHGTMFDQLEEWRGEIARAA